MNKNETKVMSKMTRYQKTRICLLFWCLFIGLGAVAGSSAMLIKPDGSILHMKDMLPYFQVLPFSEVLFQNFLFSGFALLIVNGISNLIAAYLLFMNKKAGSFLGMLFGITLMLWICIQFVIFPMNSISTAYFFFGLIQAITGFACLTFYNQEHFHFDEKEYANINPSSKTLVLYFSRMGYVRRKAYEYANINKTAICEVKALEKTEGTSGFWWCGRFGVHGWPMNIQPLEVNPESYDKIVICTPIWVFRICGPIRQLCQELKGKVRNVSYIIVHFEKFSFSAAIEEMDQLLGVTHQSAHSVCCKRGKYCFDKEVS